MRFRKRLTRARFDKLTMECRYDLILRTAGFKVHDVITALAGKNYNLAYEMMEMGRTHGSLRSR